jgi:hypothetical protein
MLKALIIKLITVKHIVNNQTKSTTSQMAKHRKNPNKDLPNNKRVINNFSETSNTSLRNLRSQTKLWSKVKYQAVGFQESFNSLNLD